MKRLAVLAVLLVVLLLALLGVNRLRDGSERAEGLRLAEAGRFPEAMPLLEKALSRTPTDLEVLTTLTLGKLAAEAADGEEYLDRWCAARPGDSQPFRLRLERRHQRARRERASAERLRLLSAALADGKHILELDPDDDAVRREVIWLQLGVGQFDAAEALCRRCLERAPGDPWLLYLMARVYHGQGKRPQAEKLLAPVVHAQPGFAEAALLYGTLHREAGRPQQAVVLLRQALMLKNCPRKDALYQLGLALAATGQAEEARRVLAEVRLLDLQDAIRNDSFPDNAAMGVQLAEAMLEAGQAEQARARLEKILAETPNYAPALRVLALYHEQRKRREP